MNVNLTPQIESLIKQKLDSGLYNSASEVVREALRLMEQQDQMRAFKLEQLRLDIRDGLASGEATALDASELKREARAHRKNKQVATNRD